jgi:hydroxypyruvate reductase/glycerate 2-kinase
MSIPQLRSDARAIWDAALATSDPVACVRSQLAPTGALCDEIKNSRRIVVVGGGKAAAAMALGVEDALADRIGDVIGIVNVPAEAEQPLQAIVLHAARRAGSNEPTAAGVRGARRMLDLAAAAGPNDVIIALISGGGSALLPAPVDGVSLEDKQAITRLLHRSGATIAEMNCVRKHLSKIKGGGLAAIARRPMYSLIISDVVGDRLDVIASGPTAPDPTTFADALAVLDKFAIADVAPAAVRSYLEAGKRSERPETLKRLPPHIHNRVLANNSQALAAAESRAKSAGYPVVNFGAQVEGETRNVAQAAINILLRRDERPVCLLIGGETTVALPPDHGKGGRNTEFVLAALLALQSSRLRNYAVLSGGTDGEDGPTDAAGALGDDTTLQRAEALGLGASDFLNRHDSYTFFDATGDLIRTGLTQTNVMDIRVVLVGNQ